MVRREAEEVEETRLDCFWPIFRMTRRTARVLHVKLPFQGQWTVLSQAVLTLPVGNVNSQLRRLIIRFIEGTSFAFQSLAFTDDTPWPGGSERSSIDVVVSARGRCVEEVGRTIYSVIVTWAWHFHPDRHSMRNTFRSKFFRNKASLRRTIGEVTMVRLC